MSATDASSNSSRIQHIPAKTEYRFELEPNERLSIRLVPGTGSADIFGSEIIAHNERWFSFGDEAKIAVSSLTGCDIELTGSVSTEYVADEASPSYTSWANLHLWLEKKRLLAKQWLVEDLRRGKSASIIKQLGNSSLVTKNEVVPVPVLTEGGGPKEGMDASGEASTSIYRSEGQGPRVMVLGPESSGKSSLIKFLANHALRSPAVCDPLGVSSSVSGKSEKKSTDSKEKGSEVTGWWPSIISIDPSVGTAPLPCTMSLLPLSPLPHATLPSPSPAYPYGVTAPTSGAIPPTASTVHLSSPYTLWLGRDNAREEEKHARRVVDWLAQALEKRLARDERGRCSGVFIDMPGVSSADGRSRYSFVQYCVRALKVDTIVILGHEKLNIEMTKAFGQENSGIHVVKIPKSGGVVELDQTFKQRLRALQVRNYFYGGSTSAKTTGESSNMEAAAAKEESDAASGQVKAELPGINEPLGGVPSLSPFSTTVPFDLLEVYRIGSESTAPSSALPIGASRALSSTQLIKLDPTNSAVDQSALVNSILALVQPTRGGGGPGQPDSKVDPPPTDDEILGSPVLGFIHVASIDTVRKKMTVLSPSPGRLPSKTALIGSLDWQDA